MDWRKYLIFGGIGIAVYTGMRYLLPAAIPFFSGWLLASLILPLAIWVERHLRIRRGIAGGILIGGLTAVSAWGIWKLTGLFVAQVRELLARLQLLAGQSQGYLDHCCEFLERITGIGAADIREFLIYQAGRLQEEVQQKMGTVWFGYTVTLVKGIVALAGGVMIAILFGTLLIKDLEEIRDRMAAGQVSGKIFRIGQKICRAGGRYLKAQFCIMALVALVCMTGFWMLKNPYFVAAGVTVGLLDALPLIGAGTILIPWSVLWLLRGEYMMAAGYFLVFAAANLTRQFLEPRIVGKEIGLHPALMLISVYGGFFLYGFAGFILGPVTVLVLRTVWEELDLPQNEKNKEKLNKKDVKKIQKS